MIDVKDRNIGVFYKDEEGYLFLIKPPFSNSSISKVNPTFYQFFTLWELKDTELFIGYLIEIKEGIKIVNSHNFLFLGSSEVSDKVNLLLNNHYLKIIEDEKLQNILIVGNVVNEQPEYS